MCGFPKRLGKHMVKIVNCEFIGLKQDLGLHMTFAALSVITVKVFCRDDLVAYPLLYSKTSLHAKHNSKYFIQENTELQLTISNSKFTKNSRALDFSLKGISEVKTNDKSKFQKTLYIQTSIIVRIIF